MIHLNHTCDGNIWMMFHDSCRISPLDSIDLVEGSFGIARYCIKGVGLFKFDCAQKMDSSTSKTQQFPQHTGNSHPSVYHHSPHGRSK